MLCCIVTLSDRLKMLADPKGSTLCKAFNFESRLCLQFYVGALCSNIWRWVLGENTIPFLHSCSNSFLLNFTLSVAQNQSPTFSVDDFLCSTLSPSRTFYFLTKILEWPLSNTVHLCSLSKKLNNFSPSSSVFTLANELRIRAL